MLDSREESYRGLHATHNHCLLTPAGKGFGGEGGDNPINQGHQEQWSRICMRALTWGGLEWNLHSAHQVVGLLPLKVSTLYQGLLGAGSVLSFIISGRAQTVGCEKVANLLLIWGRFYEQVLFYFSNWKQIQFLDKDNFHSIFKSLYILIS